MLKNSLSSFNHYPVENCYLQRPERYHELTCFQKKLVTISPDSSTHPLKNASYIARGQGSSYGDAALNKNGQVILMERLNRFIEFDPINGTLTAEGGTTLSAVLQLIIPHGWFIPVTPGTQHVSLGGCVAADVHGKNHHRVGSFGDHLLWLDLITADGSILRCSSQQHPDVFWATIGGMGLTGIIGAVNIKLIPIQTTNMLTTYRPVATLENLFNNLNDPNLEDDYSVAWLDTFHVGRSIVMTAHHDTTREKDLFFQPKKSLTIPGYCPPQLLNSTTLKLFNQLYYYRQKQKTTPFNTSLQSYFYPLDKIKHWNHLYGKRGFIQYQCVIPTKHALEVTQTLLTTLAQASYPIALGVLKRLGAANAGFLSFPISGFTLALDLPLLNKKLFNVLNQLDETVVENNGRVYLAKDARMQPEIFRAMYPRYNEWLAIKNKIDPNHIFSSSLSRRLMLGE